MCITCDELMLEDAVPLNVVGMRRCGDQNYGSPLSASAVAAAFCRCSCIFSDDELAPSCEMPNSSEGVLETGKRRRIMRAGLHPELV